MDGLVSYHWRRATYWDRFSKWSTLVVTFSAGITTISIFADNSVLAALTAVIAVGVSATNSAFSPPEAAKLHRESARAYGHLQRPLHNLLYEIDSVATWNASVETGFDQKTDQYVDVPGPMIPDFSNLTDEKMKKMWDRFSQLLEQLELIDERAPGLPHRSRKFPWANPPEEESETGNRLLRWLRRDRGAPSDS